MSLTRSLCRLLLAFATLGTVVAIRVPPDSALQQPNNTARPQIASDEEDPRYASNRSAVGIAELSSSERNRRLIPYMTFYLPAPQFPAKVQKFLAQKQPTQHQKASYSYANRDEPLDRPTAIPIPTAYVHMKVSAGSAVSQIPHSFATQNQQQQKQFSGSGGTIYRSIAYGGQHPVPALLPPDGDEKRTSLMHFLPTALPLGPPPYAGPSKYGESNGNHFAHKSIAFSHDPIAHQRRPQADHHRPKPSKINFTPFTSSNTVPGHFVPIIYAPLSQTNDDNVDYNSNSETTDRELPAQRQQIMQRDEDYLLLATTPSPKQKPALHKMQLLAAPPSSVAEQSSGVHPNSSPVYRVASETIQSPLAPSLALNTHQQQSPETADAQTSDLQPLKPNNIYDNEQYGNMTPQQEYVTYLKHQRHNQIQQRVRTKEDLVDRQQYYKQQQEQAPLFAISSTVAPVDDARMRLIGVQHQTQSEREPSQYPQHSPLRHSVFPHPEYKIPANHRIHSQQQQRLQYVPHVRPPTVEGELRTQTQTDYNPQGVILEQHPKHPSPVSNQYIDYVIEEPKQSLDEGHQHVHVRYRPQQQPIVTKESPYPLEESIEGRFYSKVAPFSNTQSKVMLKTSPHHSEQATLQTNRTRLTISPQYVHVTNKPLNYGPSLLSSPTTKSPVKFKPTYDYGERLLRPVERPASVTQADEYGSSQMRPTPSPTQQQNYLPADGDLNRLPDIHSSSLAEILHELQASNHLPQTLTPDNIDNSIKTLITILNNLKLSPAIAANPPLQHAVAEPEGDYVTGSEEEQSGAQDLSEVAPVGPTKPPGPNSGRPGIDYPNYADIPITAFDCGEQRYKGFFGDPETNCQVWHYCDLNGGKASFLCPNGTIFSQIALTCDWWFNVKCSTTSQLYVLNERLYKYILPFNPKFPEDYSGPIVDKYLALKFKEMEEQMRLKEMKASSKTSEPTAEPEQEQDLKNVDATTSTTKGISKNEAEGTQSINSQVGEQSSERNLLLDDELDDISQRGTIAAGYSTTEATFTTRTIEYPLSLKPIVVTQTSETDYDKSSGQSAETPTENHSQSKEDESASSPLAHTKISVEKVEVIEIKSDVSSRHFTPDVIPNNEAHKR